MPVDLAKDVRRLEETIVWVPGLSGAYSLATEIITTAQLPGSNKLKLQSLAHTVTDYIVNITKCLRKRTTTSIPGAKLQGYLDLFKHVLRDVANVVRKYSSLSREQSVIMAADRDKDIMELERRLRNIETSIVSLLGLNDTRGINKSLPMKNVNHHIGLTVNRPQTVHPNHRPGLAIERPRTTTISRQSTELPAFALMSFLQARPDPPKSDVSFDLSDGPSRVDPHRTRTPVGIDRPPSRTFLSRFKRSHAPNLTGNITNKRRTPFSGGFGDIYTAELMNTCGSEKVALKTLKVVITNRGRDIAKAKKNFRREVHIWCLLCHPHVLPFYGTCECDKGHLYMVSPWAEGGKLLDYLQRNPDTNRGKLLHQTSGALEYLHSGKDVPPIIHGDLKAENVLVSGTGEALLCDFGLSRCEEITPSSGSSSTGKGTARFMAPELLIDRESIPSNSKSTKESDVFAFGSLMLQTYTEKVPFADLREPQALVKLANGEVPTRPLESIVLERGLNNRVWTLMNDCWKSHPRQRPCMKDVTWRILWAVER